jgi:hypothetical protein
MSQAREGMLSSIELKDLLRGKLLIQQFQRPDFRSWKHGRATENWHRRRNTGHAENHVLTSKCVRIGLFEAITGLACAVYNCLGWRRDAICDDQDCREQADQ